jgi:hypothetical protein
LYEAFPEAPFNIEIKGHRSGIEKAVFRQIEAAGAMERTLVVSDNRGTISRFRKASQGKVATASSTVELLRYWILHVLHLGGLHAPPFQALQPPEKYKASCLLSLAPSYATRTSVTFASMSGRSTTSGDATAVELRRRRHHDRPPDVLARVLNGR